MYDLPSIEGVTKVVVDEAVIKGDAKPYLIYESTDFEKAAAEE